VNAINAHSLIHFYTNTSLDDIINEMFVDQWNYSTSYRAFYEQCRPNYCKYALSQHNSFWIILTVVLSLISDLMKILKIILPYFVQDIFTFYSRCHHQTQRETAFESIPFCFSFRIFVDRIRKFNLFPSDNPTTANDEDELRHQIISTRLFLILFLISLIILSIYSSQVQKTITVTIVNPSMEQYISGFIISSPPFYVSDFRVFGSGVFCTIASFCQLSLRAISDGLLDFDESSFVTAQVVPHFS
jgi:hypothetical protein